MIGQCLDQILVDRDRIANLLLKLLSLNWKLSFIGILFEQLVERVVFVGDQEINQVLSADIATVLKEEVCGGV